MLWRELFKKTLFRNVFIVILLLKCLYVNSMPVFASEIFQTPMTLFTFPVYTEKRYAAVHQIKLTL